MNDELMKRARELLALIPPRRVPYKTLADSLAPLHHVDDMADTIRDLLAEVERLRLPVVITTDDFGCAVAVTRQTAEGQMVEVIWEADDLPRANTESDRKLIAHLTEVGSAMATRAEAAEARLRELASAEPVLWYSEKTGVTDDRQHSTYTTALIRRPEMPS